MSNPSFRFLLLFLPVLTAGCDSRKVAVVKVTCTWQPSSPQMVESVLVVPIARPLMRLQGVEKITAISAKGSTELYVKGRSGFSSSAMLDSVKQAVESASRELPKNASITGVTLLKAEQAIPTTQPKLVDELSVNIDLKKASALGVMPQDIDSALAPIIDEPVSDDLVKKAAALSIHSVDRTHVLLGDVATVTVVKVPDIAIHTFP